MCRGVFEITTDKQKGQGTTVASSLPINHFASTVLAVAFPASSLGKRHADPNNVVCEICEENEANEHCKNCSQSYCANCRKSHLKMKISSHHQFISLDEGMKLGGGSVSRVTRCEKHPQYEINSYCRTDKQAICAECAIDHHKGHEVERLVNVVQGFKEEITQPVDKVCSYSLFPNVIIL